MKPMTKRILSIVLASSAVALAACNDDVSSSRNFNCDECSESQYCDLVNKECVDGEVCGDTVCVAPQHCDPVTETCKDAQACGDAFCFAPQYCDPATNTCKDGEVCGDTVCFAPQYCDPETTTCVGDGIRCGDKICPEGQVCVENECKSCNTGEIICDGKCIDPKTDLNYCGAFGDCIDPNNGMKCGATQLCVDGTCHDCETPNVICDGKCIDPNTDPHYCGASGTCVDPDDGEQCVATQVCVGGTCEDCESPNVICDGKCIDPNTDPHYCGASGTCIDPEDGEQCGATQVCANGTCEDCESPNVICDGKCIDPNTDPHYCGASGDCVDPNAGVKCPSDQVCVEGNCEPCEAPNIICNGKCIDPSTDPNYCGAFGDCVDPNAGVKCPSDQVCVEGNCEPCEAPNLICDGKCIDPNTDLNYCGASGDCVAPNAGVKCPSDQVCVEGNCEPCGAGEIICNGVCINPQKNDAYCGATGCLPPDNGEQCLSPQICVEGKCETPCDPSCPPNQVCKNNLCVNCEEGEIICDGTCIDPKRDVNYCGASGDCVDPNDGKKCVTGQSCVDGGCECDNNRIFCGNVCVDPLTNKEHCGASGNCEDPNAGEACIDGQSCVDGICVCDNNHILCSNACVDPMTDENYCGASGDCQKPNEGRKCVTGQSCVDGICVCDNGSILCGSGCVNPMTDKKYCGATGNCLGINAGDACIDGQSCINGICTCDTGEFCMIKAGGTLAEFACIDPKTSTAYCGCNSTSVGLNCETVANVQSGSCEEGKCKLECKPGYADCNNQAEDGCETNITTADNCGKCGNKCGNNQICLNGSKCEDSVCKDGDTRCYTDPSTQIGALQKCTNNQWVTQQNCSGNVSCKDDNKTCGGCQNNQKQCSSSDPLVPQVCQNGVWTSQTKCAVKYTNCGAKCDSGECTYSIPSGYDSFCSNVCVNTKTDSKNCGACGNVCKSDEVCISGSCKTFVCNDGDERCYTDPSTQIGALQKCTNNQWVNTQTCSGNASCKDDKKTCGGCQNNQKQCSSSDPLVPQVCQNGVWTSQTKCAVKYTNCGAKCDAGECTYSIPSGYDSFCSNACVNTKTDPKNCGACGTVCKSNEVCISGSCKIFVCNDGDERCYTDPSTQVGALQKCINNQWVNTQTCSGNASCKNDNKTCGSCQNNKKQCSSSDPLVPQVCQNGVWTSQTKCTATNGCTPICKAGDCSYEAPTGTTLCNNACVDTTSDPNNCGACGKTCGTDSFCYNSKCVDVNCDTTGYTYVDTTNYDGSEVRVKAFCVETEEQLRNIQTAVSGGTKYPSDNNDMAYILLNDIEIDGSTWVPIGDQSKQFQGYFFGNTKTISSGLPMNVNRSNYGIFGQIKKAVIEKLMIDVTMTSTSTDSYEYIGSLSGNTHTSRLSDCNSKVTINLNSGKHIGGFIGSDAYSNMDNIHVDAVINVEEGEKIGGLAAALQSGSIKNSSAKASIVAEKNIGGFVGHINDQQKVANSYSDVDIKLLKRNDFNGTSGDAAGFVYQIQNSAVEDSYSKGMITYLSVYANGVGGFVGVASSGNIKRSYSEVDIKADGERGKNGFGGFAGIASGSFVFSNCHSITHIECKNACGGFVGDSHDGTHYIDCYSEGTVDGNSHSGGFAGEVRLGGNYERCAAYVNLTNRLTQSGGFIGYSYESGTTASSINSCYDIGYISGSSGLGGLIGFNTTKITAPEGFVKNYYSFKSFADITSSSSSIGGIIGSRTKDTEAEYYYPFVNSAYFYKTGCKDNAKCLTGLGTTGAFNSEERFIGYTLNTSNEPVITDASGATTKLIDNLNAGIAAGETKFVRAKCTVDIGEGEKEYILPIIPTIKPDFCTIL